ncbi:MAG: peptidylprolyl isomerase [Lachnospiraceae bacterium]|nr:peptidylprolyl isomerase [Lachnospiraceae bacterium]
MRERNGKKGMMVFIVLLIFLTAVTGCKKGTEDDGGETKVVLTTGFAADEIFRIGKSSCMLPEIKVYLLNTKNQYESIYGARIWNTRLEDGTLEEKVKDTVIARVAQIKTMNLLAQEHEIALSEHEQKLVSQAALEYYQTLSAEEIEYLSANEQLIEQLYGEYALSDKIYYSIIQDVNPEISDDEARTITVKVIFLKNYSLDGEKNRIPYTEETKADTKKKAEEILALARSGEDFDTLINQYSEDENSTYSFGKGEMEAVLEEAAFNLSTDAISNVVETEYGYYIIKCVSTFDRKETDVNKVKIVEQRKKEAFNQVYDDFVKSQVRNLNEELWDSVTLEAGENMDTVEFFQIYDKYFQGVFQEK